MKNNLNFKIPFWQHGGLHFHNCYACTYAFMQGMDAGNLSYDCRAKKGNGCNDCGNCKKSLTPIIEKLNMLFSTMDGMAVTRQSWSGELTGIQKELAEKFGARGKIATFDLTGKVTDSFADYIIRFTGYEYKKICKEFKETIIASIDMNKPIIAEIKEPNAENHQPYRVITGYDEDFLIEPDYKPAANELKTIEYRDIECLYVFGEKIPQRYTFLEILKGIEKIMDSDFKEGIWYDFLQMFDYEGEKLWNISNGTMKERFNRLGNMGGWLSCMAHTMQQAFADKDLLTRLGADLAKMQPFLDVNGHETHLLHNCGYQ